MIGMDGMPMTKEIGNKCQLVGDDLFVTSVDRLRMELVEIVETQF